MKMQKFFILFICLFVPTLAKADIFGIYREQEHNCTNINLSEKLSLSDVMEMAICQNPELKMSYLSTQISSAGYGASLGNYLPSVTISGNIGHETGKEDAGTSEDGLSELNTLLALFAVNIVHRCCVNA